MELRIGDQCSIWNGNSSISDSRNWLIGIVMKKKNHKYWNETRYQVFWHDLLKDTTWYTANEIKLDETRFSR